jgi:hypothetical protein
VAGGGEKIKAPQINEELSASSLEVKVKFNL